jgi:hypothetical protein
LLATAVPATARVDSCGTFGHPWTGPTWTGTTASFRIVADGGYVVLLDASGDREFPGFVANRTVLGKPAWWNKSQKELDIPNIFAGISGSIQSDSEAHAIAFANGLQVAANLKDSRTWPHRPIPDQPR